MNEASFVFTRCDAGIVNQVLQQITVLIKLVHVLFYLEM